MIDLLPRTIRNTSPLTLVAYSKNLKFETLLGIATFQSIQHNLCIHFIGFPPVRG